MKPRELLELGGQESSGVLASIDLQRLMNEAFQFAMAQKHEVMRIPALIRLDRLGEPRAFKKIMEDVARIKVVPLREISSRKCETLWEVDDLLKIKCRESIYAGDLDGAKRYVRGMIFAESRLNGYLDLIKAGDFSVLNEALACATDEEDGTSKHTALRFADIYETTDDRRALEGVLNTCTDETKKTGGYRSVYRVVQYCISKGNITTAREIIKDERVPNYIKINCLLYLAKAGHREAFEEARTLCLDYPNDSVFASLALKNLAEAGDLASLEEFHKRVSQLDDSWRMELAIELVRLSKDRLSAQTSKYEHQEKNQNTDNTV